VLPERSEDGQEVVPSEVSEGSREPDPPVIPTRWKDAPTSLPKLQVVNEEHGILSLQHLKKEMFDVYKVFKDRHKDLVWLYFLVGATIAATLEAEGLDKAHAKGREDMIFRIADGSGINRSDAYRALQFYDHELFRGSVPLLMRWAEKQEGKGRDVNWRLVMNVIKKVNREEEGSEDPPGDERIIHVREETDRLEQKAIELETEADELEAIAKEIKDEEALGVSVAMRQVAQHIYRAVEEARQLGETRTRDQVYLDKVAMSNCACCGRVPDADTPNVYHHLERAGVGTKGSDYFTTPMCGVHHTMLHDYTGSEEEFWTLMGVNPWEVAYRIFLNIMYFGGQ
jgi:hypothetical protein